MLEIVSKEKFAEKCARTILSEIQIYLSAKSSCSIVLAGGNTPRAVYEKMIQLNNEYQIAWEKCIFFIGDERYVPADDPENNGRMAAEFLLTPLHIPAARRYFIDTSLPLENAALDYAERIKSINGIADNGFDIVLLGLGDDGHTLSLFPGKIPPGISDNIVLGYHVDAAHGSRITLTPMLVNRSQFVLFMVSGISKSRAVYQVAQNELSQAADFPAKLIQPGYEKLHFIVDENAAAQMDACGC